jgi:hypothetical protein
MNLKWTVGDTTITKITEIAYPNFPDLIPAATPEVVKKVQWLFPHFVTPEGKLSVSIHSLIVDTPGAKKLLKNPERGRIVHGSQTLENSFGP